MSANIHEKKNPALPQSNWFLAFIKTPNLDTLAEKAAADCRRPKIELFCVSRYEKGSVVFIVIRPRSYEDFCSSSPRMKGC